MLQGLQTRRTPQVQLVLHRTDGRRQQTAWTPDTGAEESVTSLDEATRMGINVKDLAPPASSLFTADGRELPCLGSCDIALQLGDIKRTVTVSVVKKLHSSLLSWHDAVHLGILHREFPQQIRFVTSEAQEGQGSPVGGQETEPRRSRIPRSCKATTSTPSGSTQTKTTLKDLRKPTGVGQGSPVGAQKAGPGRSRIPRRCTGVASKLSGSTQTDTTLKDQRKPTWDDRRTQPSLQEQEKHDEEAEKDFEHQRASLIASLISTAPAEEPEGSPFPSQQKEPLIMEATPTRVFEAVSADYFSWAGRAYLVYADRLSGWPFVFHCTGETSARDLVSSLRLAFAATGAPSTLRTDSGSQFAARHTRDFLRRWGVTHQVQVTSSSRACWNCATRHGRTAFHPPKCSTVALCARPCQRTTARSPTSGSVQPKNATRRRRSSRRLPSTTTAAPVPSGPCASISKLSCRIRRPDCGTGREPSSESGTDETTSSACPADEPTGGTAGTFAPCGRWSPLVAVQHWQQQRRQLGCPSRQQRRRWRHQARRQGSGPGGHQDRLQQHQHRRQRARRSSWWQQFCPRDPGEAKLASPSATQEAVGELV